MLFFACKGNQHNSPMRNIQELEAALMILSRTYSNTTWVHGTHLHHSEHISITRCILTIVVSSYLGIDTLSGSGRTLFEKNVVIPDIYRKSILFAPQGTRY